MKFDLIYKLITLFTLLVISTGVEAEFVSKSSQSNNILFYLTAGFSFGIVFYQLVLYVCTRLTIYLHFSIAFLSYTINIGHTWGTLRLNDWPPESITLMIDLVNLIFLTSFIKAFCNFVVNFRHLHPLINSSFDWFMGLGGLVLISHLLYPQPILYTIRSVLILVATFTGMITAYSWYPTLKHLRIFVFTLVLFFIFNGIYYTLDLLGDPIRHPSLFSYLWLFSGILLFLTFSSYITGRINYDRQQGIIAQKTVIHTLEKFQNLYENALDGLFTVQKNGYLLNSNPTLKKLLQLQPSTQPFYLHSVFSESENIWLHITRILSHHKFIENFEVKGTHSNWFSFSARSTESNLIEGSLIDITQRKRQSLRLAYLASHDSLTQLYNRSEFESALQKAISSKTQHTLLFIDLDQFKVINDTCGHAAGDECLRQVAMILKNHTEKQDIVARFGGDEFSIIMWDQLQAIGNVRAERLRVALEANHFHWQNRIFKTSVSIGLISIDEHTISAANALSLADAACHEAKAAGRNRVIINDPHKHSTIYRHGQMDMVATLNQALRDQQLVLFQQPIIPIYAESSHLMHYEILLRLHTDNGLLSPGAFLPAAQRYDLLPQIDRWVFRNTCEWLAKDDNHACTGIANINLSPQTLGDQSFFTFVQRCLKEYAVSPSKICFEITEYNSINNFTMTLEQINLFQGLGFTFALDDFGSGFASFDYVKRLPIDFIKIDGQFIRDIYSDSISKTMVKAITDIAHNLGKRVIAESIEDERTADMLQTLNVDFGQGYHFNKPAALYLPKQSLVMPVSFA